MNLQSVRFYFRSRVSLASDSAASCGVMSYSDYVKIHSLVKLDQKGIKVTCKPNKSYPCMVYLIDVILYIFYKSLFKWLNKV